MRKPPFSPPHVHLAYGILSFLMGFALIIGGDARVSATAYSIIATRGGPFVWGTVFVVIGTALMLSVGRRVLMQWLLAAGAVAYGVFALAFLISAWQYPEANLTAIVAYGMLSAFHLCSLYRSRRSVDELRDGRRVKQLRVMLLAVRNDQVCIRASDSRDDCYRIVLQRMSRILSDDWDG